MKSANNVGVAWKYRRLKFCSPCAFMRFHAPEVLRYHPWSQTQTSACWWFGLAWTSAILDRHVEYLWRFGRWWFSGYCFIACVVIEDVSIMKFEMKCFSFQGVESLFCTCPHFVQCIFLEIGGIFFVHSKNYSHTHFSWVFQLSVNIQWKSNLMFCGEFLVYLVESLARRTVWLFLAIKRFQCRISSLGLGHRTLSRRNL